MINLEDAINIKINVYFELLSALDCAELQTVRMHVNFWGGLILRRGNGVKNIF